MIIDPDRNFLVGGCVRNALCNRPISDVDLVTFDDGRNIAREVATKLGGAYFPLDAERQIGRAIINVDEKNLHIDASSMRDRDLESDLKKRDFTINAMAVSVADLSTIIDPLGGRQDLTGSKTLRQCKPTSIVDDPVRALRAVRLALDFRLHMEAETRNAVRSGGAYLANADGQLRQPERVRDELFKLLSLNRPGSALRLLSQLDLTRYVFGLPINDDPNWIIDRIAVAQCLADVISIISSSRTDDTAADVALGLAVMTLDSVRSQLQSHYSQIHADERTHASLILLGVIMANFSIPKDVGSRYRLSNVEVDILDTIANSNIESSFGSRIGDREIHRIFRKVGRAGIDLMLIWLAEFLAKSKFDLDLEEWGRRLDQVSSPLLRGYFHRYEDVIEPEPLVTGDTLQHEIGVSPGPMIGTILNHLKEEQAAGEIKTRAEALDFARKFLKTSEK